MHCVAKLSFTTVVTIDPVDAPREPKICSNSIRNWQYFFAVQFCNLLFRALVWHVVVVAPRDLPRAITRPQGSNHCKATYCESEHDTRGSAVVSLELRVQAVIGGGVVGKWIRATVRHLVQYSYHPFPNSRYRPYKCSVEYGSAKDVCRGAPYATSLIN